MGVSCRSGAGDAARKVFCGLRMMNHRGQDGSGIGIASASGLIWHKNSGLVPDVFSDSWLGKHADAAIGHNRYATQGDASEKNLQPHFAECRDGGILLASNGDVINYRELRAALEQKGVRFTSDNDGELLARFLAQRIDQGDSPPDAIRQLHNTVQGAYSAVALFQKRLYVFRDVRGFRPLAIVTLPDGSIAVASETVAFGILGADLKTYREVPAGAIYVIDNGDVTVHDAGHPPISPCIFELVYFARPDSQVFGLPVHLVRRRIGWHLAEEANWKTGPNDIVVAVPDSSNEIARGVAEGLGLPFEPGLIRSHTARRTFIESEQSTRDEGVRFKLNPLMLAVEGARVILVDDSIVRGTTIRKIVHMLKRAGAEEVHLFIGSPPIKWPCFMGIATPTKGELIANQLSPAAIVEKVGADSLCHISLSGLRHATGRIHASELTRFQRILGRICNAPKESFRGVTYMRLQQQDISLRCTACFSGEYPIPVPLRRS